jgi:hypothetical protein
MRIKVVSKTKGAKGGNPHPVQNDEFLEHRFKRHGDVEGKLALKPLCARVPIEVDDAVRSLPNKTEWIRNAIIAAAEKDGLW